MLPPMAEFPSNPARFDPYKNFKFRVKWDGRYVPAISRVTGLLRATEVVEHREDGDPCISRCTRGLPTRMPCTRSCRQIRGHP